MSGVGRLCAVKSTTYEALNYVLWRKIKSVVYGLLDCHESESSGLRTAIV